MKGTNHIRRSVFVGTAKNFLTSTSLRVILATQEVPERPEPAARFLSACRSLAFPGTQRMANGGSMKSPVGDENMDESGCSENEGALQCSEDRSGLREPDGQKPHDRSPGEDSAALAAL